MSNALPTIKIGNLSISRLIIGGNPFSGFSHQGPERDAEMLDYYTVDRIKETLRECERCGINTCILRVDAHIWRMLREYRNEGGTIQWIAQVGDKNPTYKASIDHAVTNGAVACFIHGGVAEQHYVEGKIDEIALLIEHIRARGLPAGMAAHDPDVHLAVYRAGIPCDFHVVCFYNCGSLHAGKGERFDEADPPEAIRAIQEIQRPCIAYKVLAAGRVPARQGLERAFKNIKPTDAVVLGMFTKDNPNMVRENVDCVRALLGQERLDVP